MRILNFGLEIFVLLSLISLVLAHVPGVTNSKQRLYVPDKGMFECFDKSKKIVFSAVNDDYCDCEDGSDEPGTSACPNGSFACTNVGYFATLIPSSRVNDNICDCCDGSDESPSKCQNTCSERGTAARIEAEKQHRAQRQGWETKQRYILEGNEGKLIRERSLVEIKERITGLQKELAELKAEKETLEAQEKNALEEQKRREELESEKKEAPNWCEEIAPKIKDLENEITFLKEILQGMKDRVGNLRIQDIEGALEQTNKVISSIPPAPVCPKPEEVKSTNEEEESSNKQDFDEEEEMYDDEESEYDDGDDDDDDDEDEEGNVDNNEEENKTKTLVENGIAAPFVEAANQARNKYNAKENELQKAENDLRNLEKVNDFDYGPQQQFFPLYSKCFQYNTLEYTYEMCPYGSAAQKPKRGGSDTSLGTFKALEVNGDAHFMKFEHGLRCWGGPDRSVRVTLTCGDENEIVSVEEPAKCEYAMEFRTPSACQEPQSFKAIFYDQARKKDPKVIHEKDEL